MSISELANPYDFANPVSDKDRFVGREFELANIRYYLGNNIKTERPINLAVTGERASGKTSILNMIQIEADTIGYCVVRIELDEGDSESPFVFFFKLFDSVLSTACSSGAYEGVNGKTYQIYRDMVDACDIPEEKTFCPFIFPMQYARAMSRGVANAALSDTAFKLDMVKIQEELQKPVLIIIDEYDVLAKSKVHIQKLRNIFMNLGRFMLVVCGTPSLFPVMDEVFSPITRQFMKINIGPFRSERETERCISAPLERIGLGDTLYCAPKVGHKIAML